MLTDQTTPSTVGGLAQIHGRPIDDPGWEAFVGLHPEATPFHLPAWAATVADTYGYRAEVLVACDSEGRLQSGLPVVQVPRLGGSRLVALPFTDEIRPLNSDGLDLGALLATPDSALQLDVHGDVGQASTSRLVGYRHRLSLPDEPDELLRQLPSARRRALRKANGSGLEVRVSSEPAFIRSFYDLHQATRRRLGVPVQPRRFFDLMGSRLLAPGFGFVSLALYGGKPIAGALFLTLNRSVVYKFGASDASRWGMRPNDAVIWAGVERAWQSGARSLDFGRTDVHNSGLRRFKRGWGAAETPLVYSSIGHRPPGAGRTPRLMATLIRRSPAFLNRVLGELLYRHAA